jgi:hypothetical protein
MRGWAIKKTIRVAYEFDRELCIGKSLFNNGKNAFSMTGGVPVYGRNGPYQATSLWFNLFG